MLFHDTTSYHRDVNPLSLARVSGLLVTPPPTSLDFLLGHNGSGTEVLASTLKGKALLLVFWFSESLGKETLSQNCPY